MIKNGIEVNGNSFNALISACSRKGDMERAEYWLNRMLEGTAEADVASFSSVIHACAKANNLERAEAWFKKMEKAGVQANIVTYNSVINACARCGNAVRAEHWFQKMVTQGIQPGVLTFNSLVNACAKAPDIVKAEHWLQEMPKHGVKPDDVTYSTVIHVCGNEQDPARAGKWLEKLKQMLAETNKKPSSFCYNSVAQAWSRAGSPDQAARLLKEAESFNIEITPASLTSITNAFTWAKRQQEANAWSAKMSTASRGQVRRQYKGNERPRQMGQAATRRTEDAW